MTPVEILIAVLSGMVGEFISGLLLKLIEKRGEPSSPDRTVISIRVTQAQISSAGRGQERRSRQEDFWTFLVVIAFCTFVVLGFMQTHLNILFPIAYGLAFFGLGFSLLTVVLHIFPRSRVRLDTWEENLLYLIAWGGEAAAVFLTRFSTARLEFFNLGNTARPMALLTLFCSMFFLLLIDIGRKWSALAFVKNRLPPYLLYSWWKGRWFFFLLALIFLAIALGISTGFLT